MLPTRLIQQVARQSHRSLLQNSLRTFSTDCEPAQKLKEVFEEYRQRHYSRETPDRFRKDIVKSIESEEGVVKKDSLNQILINIGRKDQILSDDEFGVLCKEAGTKRTLPASEAMKLLETTN